MRQTFTVATPSHAALVPIDREVQSAIDALGLRDGVLHLFTLHTTCALLINENADPDVVGDVLRRLETMVPWQVAGDRHGEGNSAAHVKSLLIGPDLTLPVQDGQPLLGTWQGVFLAEFDGPRRRTVVATALRA
ncbi:MAG: hypothetical protein COX57_13010 [Alphaproteobacteria bacterium CG_4_10_14_0_2_um_filter_63_37]|nr:MAG: hypothetical protein AUJ55_04825 [Proteobacteria bacterium CG1_02_64_396]PJA23627.1 MAG: hypothetical protein COX57_13010 [Alphaproteobacteria bacterium CG_4_10_14_0_2_um_filter_63_37]